MGPILKYYSVISCEYNYVMLHEYPKNFLYLRSSIEFELPLTKLQQLMHVPLGEGFSLISYLQIAHNMAIAY